VPRPAPPRARPRPARARPSPRATPACPAGRRRAPMPRAHRRREGATPAAAYQTPTRATARVGGDGRGGCGARASCRARPALAAGYVAAWALTLPRPSVLGTLPWVVQRRYADATGHRMSAPAVHVVRTAGTPAANVPIAMDARFETIERGGGTVRITNDET